MTQTIEQLSFYEKFCQSKFKNGIDRQEAISKDWEQLTARMRELEEENARLKSLATTKGAMGLLGDQLTQLAALQAYAEQLREALLTCQKKQIIYECRPTQNYKTYDSELVAQALALPRDTSALDAYVAEKLSGISEQLKLVIRQRDLAVEALTEIRTFPRYRMPADIANEALSTIKESEAK